MSLCSARCLIYIILFVLTMFWVQQTELSPFYQ